MSMSSLNFRQPEQQSTSQPRATGRLRLRSAEEREHTK
jgi:hypothetical protein